jgi:hypothetical protein
MCPKMIPSGGTNQQVTNAAIAIAVLRACNGVKLAAFVGQGHAQAGRPPTGGPFG